MAKPESFYERRILPGVIAAACGTRPIARQRQKIVPRAAGRVLELGFGSGLNLAYYDKVSVREVVGLEPSSGMLERSRAAVAAAPFPVSIETAAAETACLRPASFDTVLVTYALCTIPDPCAALVGARAALKPDGQLLFCEHGKAPDAGVARFQRGLEPLWRAIAGGCHLCRDIPRIVESAGFTITDMQTMYLPKTPRFAGYNYWGRARIA
jgi:SAM-dependent methyltransferase